jgi:hypothetical protein
MTARTAARTSGVKNGKKIRSMSTITARSRPKKKYDGGVEIMRVLYHIYCGTNNYFP